MERSVKEELLRGKGKCIEEVEEEMTGNKIEDEIEYNNKEK